MSDYAKELGDSIRDFNVHKFKMFLARHLTYESLERGLYNHTDDWYEGLMAKMVLARIDMPDDTRKKAKEVLDKLGWSYSVYETGGKNK